MAIVSLKQLAEGKAEGVQKATFFKVDPRVLKFEEGFNLREEGPDLVEHIARLKAAALADEALESKGRYVKVWDDERDGWSVCYFEGNATVGLRVAGPYRLPEEADSAVKSLEASALAGR